VLDTHKLTQFMVLAFAIIVIPGPSVLFTISRGVALGRRAAVATVLGNTIGVYCQVILVSLGLGSIVARSITVFTVVKLVGAAYLVYMGVQMIRHRAALGRALEAKVEAKSVKRIIREGFMVGITNPKVIVFFAATLPQFVDRGRGHVPLQMVLLGLVFITIGFLSDSAWGLLAGTARQWLARSPRRLAALGGAGGLAIIGLGIRLAVTGRHD
jgi:threonine/homoserine/homoserine lactone efflux protein